MHHNDDRIPNSQAVCTGWNVAHDVSEPLYQRLDLDTPLAAHFDAPTTDDGHAFQQHSTSSIAGTTMPLWVPGLGVDFDDSHGAVTISARSC
jgi:hypothetical protein